MTINKIQNNIKTTKNPNSIVFFWRRDSFIFFVHQYIVRVRQRKIQSQVSNTRTNQFVNVNQSAELSVLVHSIFATFKFIHYKPFFDFLSWWSSSNKFASFHCSSFKLSISIQHMTIITHNYTQIQIDKFQNALNSVVKIDGSGSLDFFHSITLHFIFFDFFVIRSLSYTLAWFYFFRVSIFQYRPGTWQSLHTNFKFRLTI